jgi:hypothetical protein
MDQLTKAGSSAADDQGGLIVDRENMEFETDGGIGVEAALGLLVLETDQTIEEALSIRAIVDVTMPSRDIAATSNKPAGL